MADERKCFAGDLGTGQIGKTVRVQVENGGEITDTLVAVRHSRASGSGESRTTVVFEHLRPSASLFGMAEGYAVEPESEVTVLP